MTGIFMINLYNFIDYRQYLSALYDSYKKNDSTFSYRSMSRLAGSSSPNVLQLIRDRKLNISTKSLNILAKSLKLNKKEEEYLETIVSFDHAKTHDEKDKFFRRILQIRGYNSSTQLQKEQYNLFSHWYIPVIRELITCKDYPDDPQWIVERIIPSVTVSQVRKGISLLESLKLITTQGPGKPWIQSSRTISTPSEVLSVAVVKYHLSTIELGKEAIARFGPAQRDIRSVTIGLSKENIPEIKKRIEDFWSELLAYAEKQKDVENVIQVNIQMFPLSKDEDN
jgi:uncharacterized protein (TIGR02147 family)